jgi:hypothetical protein
MRSLFLLLLVSGAALADDAALARCRAIADAAARLACYDAMPLAPSERKAEARPAPPQAPQPMPQQAQQQPALPQPPRGAQPQERFGLEQRVVQAEQVQTIQSHIPGRFEGWQANQAIALANGQVWQVADGSARFMSLDNPKVTIRRGALGSFFLDFENDNRSPRVRRLQ